MAHEDCTENRTGIAIFLLLGFHGLPSLKPYLFAVFLIIYLFAAAGHILILLTVASDVRLHSPMYFFLGNLSILEICCMTTIIRTLLGSLLGQGLIINLPGCVTQLSVFGWFNGIECIILTVMAYDRYAAICHPLRYTTMMNHKSCLHLTVFAWVFVFLIAMVNNIVLSMVQFPDYNKMDHFFCDFTPLVKVMCSDRAQIENEVFFFSIVLFSTPCLLVLVSYINIIGAILKIPSTKGKNKAFSTCSSHLTIVVTFFGMLILMYLVPSASSTHSANKSFSLLYTVGTPLFNPIVYTLRNKEMREALKKYLSLNSQY